MGDHVHSLTEAIAATISSTNGQHSAQENWVSAERRVQEYFSLKRWENPSRDIAWYLDNCALPSEYENGRRQEKAWEYLVLDVFQLPTVANEESSKNIKGEASFMNNGLRESMRGFVCAGVDD